MSISPGSKVGQYEILAPVGSGGMGQVFRAKDTKLGRQVTINVLHSDEAMDLCALRSSPLSSGRITRTRH